MYLILSYCVKFFKKIVKIIAPAGFWPRGQNPRRHPRVPHMYTYKEFKEYKEFEESKKCVGSRGSFLDLMKLGAHGCLG